MYYNLLFKNSSQIFPLLVFVLIFLFSFLYNTNYEHGISLLPVFYIYIMIKYVIHIHFTCLILLKPNIHSSHNIWLSLLCLYGFQYVFHFLHFLYFHFHFSSEHFYLLLLELSSLNSAFPLMSFHKWLEFLKRFFSYFYLSICERVALCVDLSSGPLLITVHLFDYFSVCVWWGCVYLGICMNTRGQFQLSSSTTLYLPFSDKVLSLNQSLQSSAWAIWPVTLLSITSQHIGMRLCYSCTSLYPAFMWVYRIQT